MKELLKTTDADSVDLVDIFKTLLVGRKIVKIESSWDGDVLICDDGTRVTIKENEGCGGCGNGWSRFAYDDSLVDNNNAIIDVDIDRTADAESFVLSIFKECGKISKINTDDGYGNGYYGGGFQISAKKIEFPEEGTK